MTFRLILINIFLIILTLSANANAFFFIEHIRMIEEYNRTGEIKESYSVSETIDSSSISPRVFKNKVDSSDSITYFVTSAGNFSRMKNSFNSFGEKIGEKHLAIHVDLMGNNKSKGKGITEFDSIAESVCDFHPVFEDFIIFEDRIDNSCYVFAVDSNGWLLSTLHQISINLDNSKNLKSSERKNNMMHGIDFDEAKEAVAQNRWIVGDFIDYLLSKI